jgi:mono/diheme cytochrome c family protein
LHLISDGKATGQKHTMPAYKDELSTDERQALLTYLRSLGKRP